jgi:hypothetical protein
MNTANNTYTLFGSTNGYQASVNASFKGRTRIAMSYEFCTAERASAILMRHCLNEDDNYTLSEDGTKVLDLNANNEVVMALGDMAYGHDGYHWEFIRLDELDEKDAAIVLRGDVSMFGPEELEKIYARHEDLRPVTTPNTPSEHEPNERRSRQGD